MTDTELAAPNPAADTFLNAPSATAREAVKEESAPLTGAAGIQPNPQTDTRQDPPSYDGLTLPEDISFAPETLEAFKTLAREINLTQAQAQKLVDYEAALAARGQQDAQEEKRQTLERWARQTRDLYGAKLEEELSFALCAADAFGGPDFRALLEDTGLGNHPVIIRMLSGVGKAIGEDAFSGGKPAAPQDKTFAEALYGKQ